ncbi:hypothetical protein BCR35DRAFT_304635 [Leucosporidium creatinivorum]|uniref:Uncharacterized protein n=1 Tax=Leucosporidium creatinivorum TaxID=106004 RepID=A0A1Y2F7G4_9BASI|nr:hypothetical protein BCR35DRAFT_304635 [Leucosporidium creatinivorum]
MEQQQYAPAIQSSSLPRPAVALETTEQRNVMETKDARGEGSIGEAVGGRDKTEGSMAELDALDGPVDVDSAQERHSSEVAREAPVEVARPGRLPLASPSSSRTPSPSASRSPSPSPSSTSNSPSLASRTYSSREDFYESVRELLKNSHGVTMWKAYESDDYVVVSCGRRKATGCRWRMRANRRDSEGGECWTVVERSRNFNHDHGEGDVGSHAEQESEMNGEETADAPNPSPPESLQRPSRTSTTSANAGRSSTLRKRRLTVSHPPSSSTRSPASVRPSPASTSQGICPYIPNAPKVNDRYASIDAAILSYEQIVVPVLGINVSQTERTNTGISLSCNRRARSGATYCGYRIVLRKDEHKGDWVVAPGSRLKHSHGPRQEILNDPSWRPHKRKLGVIANRKRARREPSNSESEAEATSDDEYDSHAISSSANRRYLPLPARAPRPPPLIDPPAAPSIHQPRFTSSPAASLLTTSTFLPTLTLFLSSLHPSLSSLASTLFAAGITDMALLVRFAGIEEELRDAFLTDVGVGLLQKRLLRKVLREAKAREWVGAQGY